MFQDVGVVQLRFLFLSPFLGSFFIYLVWVSLGLLFIGFFNSFPHFLVFIVPRGTRASVFSLGPVTHVFLNFVMRIFDFSRAYYRKLSWARPKVPRSFFPKFSRASWKIHGHFDVCHGHFCALISIFLIYSSRNKGDIWSLSCREFTIFSKNKEVIKP